MGPSWTAAPSRSTSLARAKSVRAEAAVVANSAAVVAVAAAATKSQRVFIQRGSGENSASLFSYIIPLTRPEGHPPHEPRGTSNIDQDRKSTRLNSSHVAISYSVFCLKKKKQPHHVDVIGVKMTGV